MSVWLYQALEMIHAKRWLEFNIMLYLTVTARWFEFVLLDAVFGSKFGKIKIYRGNYMVRYCGHKNMNKEY